MMKIAFATDDGEKISAHLGEARYFKVFTVDNGQPLGEPELRDKKRLPHHDHSEHDLNVTDAHSGRHMLEAITDCQVLVARGMGRPIYQRAQAHGMQVYATAEREIIPALTTYLNGTLTSDPRRVHQH